MLTTGVLGRPTTWERSRRSTISVLIRRADSGWSAIELGERGGGEPQQVGVAQHVDRRGAAAGS